MTKKKDKLFSALDRDYLIKKIPCFFGVRCCDCGLSHMIIIDWAGKDKIKIAYIRGAEDDIEAYRKIERIKIKKI